MRSLAFSGAEERIAGRRVRASHFEERSAFPISAGCLIANAVRETLTVLFGTPVEIRLFEPVVPSVQGWRAITADAQLLRLSGTRTDAVIVLRPDARVGLAHAAFGERAPEVRPLSPLEESVLERVVHALAPAVGSICGTGGDTPALVAARDAELAAFASYVELQLERPVALRIGLAFSRELLGDVQAALPAEALLDVGLELRILTDGAPVPASELAEMELGTIVPITVSAGLTAQVLVAGRPIARGECGVRGNRLALAIGLSPCTEGSSEPEPCP